MRPLAPRTTMSATPAMPVSPAAPEAAPPSADLAAPEALLGSLLLGLIRDDPQLDLGLDFLVQLDLDRVHTELFDGLGEQHVALVDVVACFLQLGADVRGL